MVTVYTSSREKSEPEPEGAADSTIGREGTFSTNQEILPGRRDVSPEMATTGGQIRKELNSDQSLSGVKVEAALSLQGKRHESGVPSVNPTRKDQHRDLPEKPKEINIVEKKPRSDNFSDYLGEFIDEFEKRLAKKGYSNGDGNIKVSEVLGSIARLYERIRTTVEYKGEHVLRRNAIERILKRLVWEKGSLRSDVNTKGISETLLKELIWARYLKNDSVPKLKIEEVQKIIDKYFSVLRNLDNIPQGTSPGTVRNWIWGIASSEIEEAIDPSNRELYVKLMHGWFKGNFIWKDTKLPDHEKDIQIHLAIHRAFTKSDDQIMRYHLLVEEYPNWNNLTKDEIYTFINSFPKIYAEIEGHLNFSGRFVLYRKLQKHAAALEIFRSIAQEEGLKLRKLLESEKKFEEKIRDVCENKYQQIKKKVTTGIVRSIIYIFITKVVLALVLEIPYEIYRYGDIRYIPLFINIGFPPFLMWLIGISIGVPGAKNTQIIVDRLKSVAFQKDEITKAIFTTKRIQSNSLLISSFSFIYTIMFILVFGGIYYLLLLLNFSIFATLVFFVFISLVLLFAYRVRFNATQLKAEADKDDIFGHLFSYLTLPFLNFGFILSRGLARLNFLTILLDFIIEAPLKSIIEVFEEWTSFIREKREEVIEVPES